MSTTKKIRTLSKSRLADGLQCLKKVYLSIHQPDLKAEVTEAQQAVFDSGTDIGVEARKTFPGGVLVDREYWDIKNALKDTKELIEAGTNTIYEAALGNGEYYCAVDILERKDKNSPWNVYEVKSGLDPKAAYILDVAIQCWILNQLGIKWDSAFIVHLNRECEFPNLDSLFVRSDVTDSVNDLLEDLENSIADIRSAVQQTDVPLINIGRHCDNPYECGFKGHCWNHVPKYSVFDLPLSWRLFEKGYLSLDEVNPDDLSDSQKRPFDVAMNDHTHVDKKGIKKAIEKWKFPIYHLDFETIGPAVPRYPGTRPYTAIPFQFSLHIQNEVNKEPEHFEYLHNDDKDPRRPLAEKLVEWIPKDAPTVMAFNSSFERGVLTKLAGQFTDLSEHLLAIAEKLVDPHPVFKANVYHKDFRGSFSIKYIAPALLGDKWDYGKLEVGDGKMAQIVFDRMLNSSTSHKDREIYRQQLLAYCEQDTLAMVELTNWLFENLK